MNSVIEAVTQRIIERSRHSRQAYLNLMRNTMEQHPPKKRLSCGNLAHAYAACGQSDKQTIRLMQSANISITTAFNDMLSAHQPLETYPQIIKETARAMGSTAQVAGGVPAMCDGVTQGQPGMELSLFSREVVAMATAVGLSHNMFDGNMFLGVCDKIVPGMLIGALQFGHIPGVFVPAGPMPSGIPNKEKAKVRQQYAAGIVGEDKLLETESASYHSAGTCTFYGTANTNQMMVEMLGVQLPGSSFVYPGTELRDALTRAAVEKLVKITDSAGNYRPLYEVITEKSIVNSIIGLLATGGSTNHTLHIVAVARAAGIEVTWADMDELSRAVPLLARVYPNGEADVNQFQQAGGMAYLVRELRSGGLLNEDVVTIMGEGLEAYEKEPMLNDKGQAEWVNDVPVSRDDTVVRPVTSPFDKEGGLRLLKGNLGQGVIKISAVAPENRVVEAPCIVFEAQEELIAAFKRGELEKDFVAVVRFQGPSANGMPELHKMTPPLGVLQDKGFKVALVTDGRMSGASGKVPAGIHLSPEASKGGLLNKLRTGDVIRFDAEAGVIQALVSDEELAAREPAVQPVVEQNLGRSLFGGLRDLAGVSLQGGTVFDFEREFGEK
ncbi:phosphogluconate dehydratase [Saccharophagus degradans]|uniref:Phosphogluconate dehydratase n=2 Tax=Saccharophagus degradans TaxID=86304 RepID=Q21KY6_SACD2|nr:phosphogluconate dehydratase [Saccharophagus degradans]ABD80643.1 6-phosphogluconate dehydratase [Saccharophagus degradans 2-40]MDO6421952.1 phosphogluconate dehydratase [Saccharophagus degradans]MDO6606355.1 phosphogluconate dehydratase [Saccharophagus degradans]WGO97175.1 phosphogluconate dehydratase [Saccharophagus degradans]